MQRARRNSYTVPCSLCYCSITVNLSYTLLSHTLKMASHVMTKKPSQTIHTPNGAIEVGFCLLSNTITYWQASMAAGSLMILHIRKWNFRSQDAKMSWNFHSQERKIHRNFDPVSENDMELSFPVLCHGLFIPGYGTNIQELNCLQLGLRILLLSCSNLDCGPKHLYTHRPTHRTGQ